MEDCIISVCRFFLWFWYRVVVRTYGKIRKFVYRNKPIEFLMRKDLKQFRKQFYK